MKLSKTKIHHVTKHLLFLGKLSWRVTYIRGPTCYKNCKENNCPKYLLNGLDNIDKEEDQNNDKLFISEELNAKAANFTNPATGKPYGNGYWYCCDERERCAKNNYQDCDQDCNIDANARIRMTGPDMGLYLKWDINADGYPAGCEVFDNVKPNKWLGGKLGKYECGENWRQDIPGE